MARLKIAPGRDCGGAPFTVVVNCWLAAVVPSTDESEHVKDMAVTGVPALAECDPLHNASRVSADAITITAVRTRPASPALKSNLAIALFSLEQIPQPLRVPFCLLREP